GTWCSTIPGLPRRGQTLRPRPEAPKVLGLRAPALYEGAMTLRRAACGLLALVLVLLASLPARAESECPAAEAWASASAAAPGSAVAAETCGHERAIFRIAAPGGAPIRVEVARRTEGAFRRAGALGLWPILQVDDWQADVPAPTRSAFDGLASCV